MCTKANCFIKDKQINKIKPNKTWNNLKDHYLNAIEDTWYKVIINLQHNITILTMKFYEEKNMQTLYLPITTNSISSPMGLGSDSLPVKVNLCGVDCYLADSMQFMLEYGCRLNSKGVYYIMPSFRGEDADERHLCQFYHSEAEIIGNMEDAMCLVEDYIKYLCKGLIRTSKKEIESVTGDISHIERIANFEGGFPRITLDKAIEIFDKEKDSKNYYEIREEGFKVITSAGERKVIELYDGIVWITHFDSLSVPFYQAFDEKDHTKAKNADLLFGIGEVVGLGERHTNREEVCKALEFHKVDKVEYEWYCCMKEEYPLKTSGFGMGIERFILWILKHNDIRDCQLLPRFNGVNVLP